MFSSNVRFIVIWCRTPSKTLNGVFYFSSLNTVKPGKWAPAMVDGDIPSWRNLAANALYWKYEPQKVNSATFTLCSNVYSAVLSYLFLALKGEDDENNAVSFWDSYFCRVILGSTKQTKWNL